MKYIKNFFIFSFCILVLSFNVGCAWSNGHYAVAVGIPADGSLTTAPSYDCYGRPIGGSKLNFRLGIPTIEATRKTRRMVYDESGASGSPVYAGQPVNTSAPADDIDVN